MDCYERMKESGIELPAAPSPCGLYRSVVKTDAHLYYTSGVGCKKDGEFLYKGQIGKDITIEQGQEAARQSVLNLLSVIQRELGDLRKVKRIVKILGFVSSADGFGSQPKVMDAASELLIKVFGEENGRAARSAIGTNALPGNQAVEIEMVFEVEE